MDRSSYQHTKQNKFLLPGVFLFGGLRPDPLHPVPFRHGEPGLWQHLLLQRRHHRPRHHCRRCRQPLPGDHLLDDHHRRDRINRGHRLQPGLLSGPLLSRVYQPSSNALPWSAMVQVYRIKKSEALSRLGYYSLLKCSST